MTDTALPTSTKVIDFPAAKAPPDKPLIVNKPDLAVAIAVFRFSQLPQRERVAQILEQIFSVLDRDVLLDMADYLIPFIETDFLNPYAGGLDEPDSDQIDPIDPVSGLNETDLTDREHGG